MLFNSYIFIFIFLPITLSGYYWIGGRGHHRIAISWLVAASLFFYGWWNPAYLGLMLGSILFNYAVGVSISSKEYAQKKFSLVFGICANLSLLIYFKYANFFINNINTAFEANYHLEKIVLPLAISFFTFQQIAYLVDTYKGKTREYNFLQYCLFVSFFPQLIAGPIVHHKEMLPQFSKAKTYLLNQKELAIGITIFIIGLFKKVVLADGVAAYSTPIFDAVEVNITLTFFEAWIGALAYTLQIYFDFSGYSDMAIGLGYMFGIRLPINFESPYQAINIIDFWRRWHITLSRFLRDYLYIPLGGNRKGNVRRYINLMLTMLLGGLWHGAGWTFLFWGALHGAYLIINLAWRKFRQFIGQDLDESTFAGRCLAWSITFLSVVVSWVFFRAESFNASLSILSSMFGLNGISCSPKVESLFMRIIPEWFHPYLLFDGFFENRLADNMPYGVSLVVVLFLIAKFSRNGIDIVLNTKTKGISWSPKLSYVAIVVLMFCISIFHLRSHSEFLYFQF